MKDWYSCTDEDIRRHLLDSWNIKSLTLFGKYERNENATYGFFNDCRSIDFEILDLGDLIDNTQQFAKVRSKVGVFAQHRPEWQSSGIYKIAVELAPLRKRKLKENPFLLQLNAEIPVELLTQKEFIEQRFQLYADAPKKLTRQLAKAVKTITAEINKKPETFIYELLQNADDFPTESKKVKVRFDLTDKYLVLTHDGRPFDFVNVDALCGINEGDKREKRDTIGFKGIGFKAVFKDCNYVLINSGGFSFRFDEVFFRSRSTPWPLIPIWTSIEQTDLHIWNTTNFGKYPVSFALKPKDEGVLRTDLPDKPSYRTSLLSVFSDERVLLFLRHVERVAVCYDRQEIVCEKEGFNWWKSSFPFIVDETQRDLLNKEIDRENDKIPEKFKNIEQAEISFAARRKGRAIQSVENDVLFAYLPTRISLGLPFLINADFIPDGSREGLHDLQWNTYLLSIAGQKFPEWLQKIGQSSWTDKSGTNHRFNSDFIKLLPDFDSGSTFSELLNAFKSGFDNTITKFAFIPDRNGDLKRLDEILVDTTGLANLIGSDFFLELCDEKRFVLHLDRESTRKLTFLINEYGEGKIFDEGDLANLLGVEAFRRWLQEPNQNAKFLQLLSKKGWLSTFKEKLIFLDQNSELHSASMLWDDLSDDTSLLSWLSPSYLHPEVRQAVSDLDLPIANYTVKDFVEKVIFGNSSEVDSILDQKTNNLNFYRYLFKHRNKFPLEYFSKNKLHWFKVWGEEEYISSFQDNIRLYVHNPVVADLLATGTFPSGHFYLLSPDFSEKIDDQAEWKQFWQEKFGVSQYLPAAFLQKEILDNIDQLNAHCNDYEAFEAVPTENYLQRQRGSVRLWQYIAQTLPKLPSDEHKQAKEMLKELVVFTTNNGGAKPLCQCFLSKKYTDNSTVEELASEHNLSLSFVADYYLAEESMTKNNWRELFITCHARKDEVEVVEQSLLPNLSSFSEEKLLDATRLIFKHQSQFENRWELMDGLKIKTISGDWILAKKAILGTAYMETDYFEAYLPTVQLNNVVSPEYVTSKHVSDWNRFFRNIGVICLNTESSVIDGKIEYLLANQSTLNTPNTSFTLVAELFKIHQQGKLTKEHYEKLSELMLLTNSSKTAFLPARECHLASIYKPPLDLEQLLGDTERPDIFVSPGYQQGDEKPSDLKGFFIMIAVNEDFKINSAPSILRANLPSLYRTNIDQKDKSISTHAQSYGSQHSIDPWITLNYSKYLSKPSIAQVFWQKMIKDEMFRKKAIEPVNYRFYGPTKVANGLVFQFITESCIPTIAGTCAKPHELLSYRFKEYVDEKGLIPCIDLSNVSVDGNSLENWLGIKQELSLRFCLRRIKNIQDFLLIEQEGIWEKTISILSQNPLRLDLTDETARQEFIKTCSLPNQQGIWQPVSQLHYITDGFKPGLGRYAGLIDNRLIKLAGGLSIKPLTKNDFQFKPNGDERKENFMSHLTERLKFIALAENQMAWSEFEVRYRQKLAKFSFWRTKQITFSFGDGPTAIKSTEENFLEDNANIYYVGNWREYRAGRLFSFIHKQLELNISEKQLIDFLLFEDADQILDFFEERDHPVPTEWRRKSIFPPEELNVSVANSNLEVSLIDDRNEEELAEKQGRTEAERISDNDEAKYVVSTWLTNNGFKYSEDMFKYDVIEGVLHIVDGVVFSVLVSSVKAGKLYFSPRKWLKLDSANTFLLVVGARNNVKVFYSQQDLLAEYARTLFRVSNSHIDPDGLSAIADMHAETKSFQFVFYNAEEKFDSMFNNQTNQVILNSSEIKPNIQAFDDVL